MKQHESTLTKKQIMLSRAVMGGALLLLGLFLLLTGLGVFPGVEFKYVVLPACLFAAGLAMFILAFIQQNTHLLWLSCLFALAALVSVLTVCTSWGYARLYPIYILSPAAASLATALYSGVWRDHAKVILLFTITAALFSLNSFFGVDWQIVVPLFIILLGAALLVYALRRNR